MFYFFVVWLKLKYNIRPKNHITSGDSIKISVLLKYFLKELKSASQCWDLSVT